MKKSAVRIDVNRGDDDGKNPATIPPRYLANDGGGGAGAGSNAVGNARETSTNGVQIVPKAIANSGARKNVEPNISIFPFSISVVNRIYDTLLRRGETIFIVGGRNKRSQNK